MKKISMVFISVLCFIAVSGCSDINGSEIYEEDFNKTTAEETQNIAGEDETASVNIIETENLSPVYGDNIKNGKYEIKAESSSSMFNIIKCELIVSDGDMKAVMTMNGKGYLHLFMGKGEDAGNTEDIIPFAENEEGLHTFTIPVKALDMPIDCAAFSRNKEKWYDRTLVFYSDSLPIDAFIERKMLTSEELGLKDGEYSVDVTLKGGSGHTSIQSPAKVTVKDKAAFAEIIWSSPNYDYMKVNGQRFNTVNDEGNSVFIIPITGFDYKMPVLADTTAMSIPYEIEYTLYFDSASIK